MAIRTNATADVLTLAGSLPSNFSFTIMGDFKIVADIGATTIQPLFWALDGANTDGYSLFWSKAASSSLMEVASYDAGAATDFNELSSRPAVGQTFCAYMKCSGSGTNTMSAGWRYPHSEWVRSATIDINASTAQVTNLFIGGVLGVYYADSLRQNVKIWDRALSDAELSLESRSDEPVVLSGLHSYFPLAHLGDIYDRGPKRKVLTKTGTMETGYINFPRYRSRRRVLVAEPPAATGTFQILAGLPFSLAGAHGLAGD